MTKQKTSERQVDGDHYIKLEYQSWDFSCDANLHYLLATAVKYVARWRDKNGVRDLFKCAHYLEKAEERKVQIPDPMYHANVIRFIAPMKIDDGEIIMQIMLLDYDGAIDNINKLIAATQTKTSRRELINAELYKIQHTPCQSNTKLACDYADFMKSQYGDNWDRSYNYKLSQLTTALTRGSN